MSMVAPKITHQNLGDRVGQILGGGTSTIALKWGGQCMLPRLIIVVSIAVEGNCYAGTGHVMLCGIGTGFDPSRR
jgi:hypothetical protein